MIPTFQTERLLIKPLTTEDAPFFFELVNTDDWLRFIGDKNIYSIEDADSYIKRIIDNGSMKYWLVKLRTDKTKIGIITFVKRDYLEHPDIGFAFLPAFFKKGYAFEATKAVLKNIIRKNGLSQIAAVTDPENEASIRLLKKLGLNFEKEIMINESKLIIYKQGLASGHATADFLV